MISFDNWNTLGNRITRFNNETGGSSLIIKGQDRTFCNIAFINLKGIEHDLNRLFSISHRISSGLGQHNALQLGWVTFELVLENALPNFFHLIPFFNDSFFYQPSDIRLEC